MLTSTRYAAGSQPGFRDIALPPADHQGSDRAVRRVAHSIRRDRATRDQPDGPMARRSRQYLPSDAALRPVDAQRRLIARATEIGKIWPELPETRQRAFLTALIERIDIGDDQIDIHIARHGLLRSSTLHLNRARSTTTPRSFPCLLS